MQTQVSVKHIQGLFLEIVDEDDARRFVPPIGSMQQRARRLQICGKLQRRDVGMSRFIAKRSEVRQSITEVGGAPLKAVRFIGTTKRTQNCRGPKTAVAVGRGEIDIQRLIVARVGDKPHAKRLRPDVTFLRFDLVGELVELIFG